ncbi:MAG: hypothetical protein AAB268_04445 [Elusimicrobiota bacterium]
MKKIRLALCVLALLALPISHASAFSHSFSNETDHTVYFLVDYTACPSDSWDVKAGETITWRSGLCCIKATSAKIDNSTEQGRQGVVAIGSWTGTLIGRMPSSGPPVCGRSNWKIDRTTPTGEPILENY